MLLGIEQRSKLDAIHHPHEGELSIPHRDQLDLRQGKELADDEGRQGFCYSSKGCYRGGDQLLRGFQGAADRVRLPGSRHR